MHEADEDQAGHHVMDREATEDTPPTPEGRISAEHGPGQDARKLAEDVADGKELARSCMGDVVKKGCEPRGLETVGTHPDSQQDGDAKATLQTADGYQAQRWERSAQQPQCFKLALHMFEAK